MLRARCEKRKRAVKLSPLDGKIVSIKDLFDVKDEVTTAGSKILRDAMPASNTSPIVQRLRKAGAVIIGKTNMSEFAFHGIGTNPHFGTPGNAVNRLHVPGGSSSGAAVSAAEGSCDIAIGTDTGGSIRLPASFNGIAGYKPSQKRVTRAGAFPLSHSLDSIGGLARSLQACIDTDGVLAGVSHDDVQAMPLSDLRIALPRGLMIDEADLHVRAAFNEAVMRLRERGISIVDVNFDPFVIEIMGMLARGPIVAIEAAAIHKEWAMLRPQDYDPAVLFRIQMGLGISGADYIRALWKRSELISLYKKLMKGFNVMIAPTALTTAPLIADVLASNETFLKANARALRNCTVGNILDVCGLSLPCKTQGMPVGFMMMGVNGSDKTLMRAGLAVEGLI
jgi:aspartyl-tRNA(Asn)/glutamyl-tRNA(Gln) amidotransferase subunit A